MSDKRGFQGKIVDSRNAPLLNLNLLARLWAALVQQVDCRSIAAS